MAVDFRYFLQQIDHEPIYGFITFPVDKGYPFWPSYSKAGRSRFEKSSDMGKLLCSLGADKVLSGR